jgi:hypothetical protein
MLDLHPASTSQSCSYTHTPVPCHRHVRVSSRISSCGGHQNRRLAGRRTVSPLKFAPEIKFMWIARMSVTGSTTAIAVWTKPAVISVLSTDIEDLKPRIRGGWKKAAVCECTADAPESKCRFLLPKRRLRKSQSWCSTCADDVNLYNYPYPFCFMDTGCTVLDQ